MRSSLHSGVRKYELRTFGGSWLVCAATRGEKCCMGIFIPSCKRAAFCFPPRLFGQYVSKSSFPIFAVRRTGAEFAPSGGAQGRAAPLWRRVGSVREFSPSDGCWSGCSAAAGVKCSMGMFILPDEEVKLLFQAHGRHFVFLPASLGRNYPAADFQFSRFGA